MTKPAGRNHLMKKLAAATSLMAMLALAACTPALQLPTPPPDETTSPTWESSLDLVGLWQVTEAEGAAPQTWLAIYNEGLTLWTPCVGLNGQWAGDGARLRAQLSSGFGPCIEGALEPASWFASIAGYQVAVDGSVVLVDEAEDAVALLTKAIAPAPFDFQENGMQEVVVPVVTDEARAAQREPAELGGGLVAVDDKTLAGRWDLAEYNGRGDPHVTFRPEGSYVATDGCNSSGGPLLVNEGGRISAGSGGGSTQVGCDNVDLPRWIVETGRAGIDLDSGELVLQGQDGSELARLVRA